MIICNQRIKIGNAVRQANIEIQCIMQFCFSIVVFYEMALEVI